VNVKIGVDSCCIHTNIAEEYAPVKTVDPLHKVSLVDGVTNAVID
jgi:hypothetical protein